MKTRRLLVGAVAALCLGGTVAVSSAAIAAPFVSPVQADVPTDSMTMFDVTDANVAAVAEYSKKKPIVLEFSNQMCMGCQDEKKVYIELSTAAKGKWLFGYTDNEKAPNLQKAMNAELLPTSVLVYNGQEIARKVDFTKKEDTVKWLNESLAKIPNYKP